jgi:hypothetical protein
MKTYHGSCHCKKVQFEAGIDLSTGTGKCNCTNCWKKRFWSARAKVDDFKPIAGADQLSGAKPGEIGGGFCTSCGVFCYAYVAKSDWNPEAYVEISVASLDVLDPAELVAAPVTYYDGLHDNWWNPPAETRHL